MKILVINYEYPPIGGGGGFVTRDIFEEIAAKGHSVTVITSHYQGTRQARSGKRGQYHSRSRAVQN